MKDLLDLHLALNAAGLNIEGVCGKAGGEVRINGWQSPPTPTDLAKADAIIKAFDWSDPLPLDAEAAVAKLTPAQKQKLLDLAAIEAVKSNPKLLEKV